MRLNIISFLKEGIWLIQEQDLPASQAAIIKPIKITLLSIQGFSRDLCPLRASALTLYSLLSIVPIIAMLFGIAKGFGFELMLEQQLLAHVPHQETTVLQLIRFARNLLDSTKGEVIAGIGVIVLFWTIINVIGNIEKSFNSIWKIAQERSLSRKFSDYLSLMLLAPVLLIAASSITVILNTEITWLITLLEFPPAGTWLVIRALSLIPLLLMIGLFTFTFIFMPNHKINFKAGLIAGVVTGISYSLLQWVYLSLQIGVSSYNAIYGSFAALPLFVVWLQIGWLIVLFGCELAYFLQNYENYRNNNRFDDLSFFLKKIIALQISHLIIKNFSQMNKPLTASEIATRLALPIAIIRPALVTLIACRIIVALDHPDEDDEIYQPAVDINKISIAFVISALEKGGNNKLPENHQQLQFIQVADQFMNLIEASELNCLLKDM